MKIIHLLICLIISSKVCAQDGARERAVLEVIKSGIAERKLPLKLLNPEDSINYPQSVVAVETTRENKLEKGYHLPLGNAEVWIWTREEIRSYEPYWMTPAEIEFDTDEISFVFTTNSPRKNDVLYQGKVKGKKEGDRWTLKKCKLQVTNPLQ